MIEDDSIYIWDRKKGVQTQASVYKKKMVKAVHEFYLGRLFYRLVLARPVVSRLLGLKDYTSWSRKKIPEFIKRYRLDTNTFTLPVESFKTFNDFFIRELRSDYISFASGFNTLCSPCEAQLKIVRCQRVSDKFTIKGVSFELGRIIGNREIENRFHNFDLCSFYLAPQYYHRFHFPVDCEWLNHYVLGNRLFAVNDFSFRYGFRPFDVNVRHINLLQNEFCGEFLYIEFGATLVGKIHQFRHLKKRNGTFISQPVKKGEQKGYFSLGGSAVLLVFAANKVEFSQDILKKNQDGLPVWVRPGEEIGKLCAK